jgi:inhibitor of KinA sporulation pathway (predicted exonuclease)
MNYIVLDLEATCWKDRSLKKTNEIIEIGALKFDAQGDFVNEFAEFVRPKLNPVLSDFCTQLTSITQEQVASAEDYPAVLQRFWDWIDLQEPFVLCSWGFYDKKQFKQDCQLHDLDTQWLRRHISVKHQYAKLKGLRKPLGMGGALRKEGFQLDGTHHRGIDDARNIAKVFQRYFEEWEV